MNHTRRELLEKCVAAGVVTVAASGSLSSIALAWDTADNKRTPTPFCELGPFYKRDAPHIGVLRNAGDAGLPLSLSGFVYSSRGETLPEAKLEIWQTDHFGHYDLDGYRYRTTLKPDEKAAYGLNSVMPGHYPARVAQHVHYLATAPGHKPMVTQLYFATDPAFDGDPEKNLSRDPLITSRELVRPVLLKQDKNQMIAVVSFDLVLERA